MFGHNTTTISEVFGECHHSKVLVHALIRFCQHSKDMHMGCRFGGEETDLQASNVSCL